MAARPRWAALLVIAAALVGCGGSDESDEQATTERADPPAKPPDGWRTVRNRTAGFSISAPKSWKVDEKEDSSTLRSRGRQLVVTVVADRSRLGRELPAADYARQALSTLPEFEGSLTGAERRVAGARYSSARVEGSGRFRASRRPQRITVAAFRRRAIVTYSVVVFRNAIVDPRLTDRTVDRLLRSLRGRPPTSV